MWADLPKTERDYLLRGAVSAAAIVLGVVLFWSSPLSPAHLDRTAARAASGDVNGAVKDYLSQADSIASRQSRGEALWRAAVLTHVAKSEPQTAVSMLERLIEIFPEHPRVVDAHARIAMIERHHDGDAIRAAKGLGQHWNKSHSLFKHEAASRLSPWPLSAPTADGDACAN